MDSLREKLMAARSGLEAHRLLDRLKRAERDVKIAILREYALSGPIGHVRTHATALLVDLVKEEDASLAAFFETGLADPLLAYWSVEGLVRVLGTRSFPVLAQFASDSTHSLEDRAKAIREIGLLGGQAFMCGRPSDPGEWKDLPLEDLQRWADAGFPPGPGFSPPPTHARLNAPEDDLDRIAAKLEGKLAKLRRENQDPVNPSNWLSPAADSDLAALRAKWDLPAVYVEFLTRFSPVRVVLVSRKYFQGLDLFGAGELLRSQDGYSYNPITAEPVPDWPADLVVIASHAGDPYALDLSRARNGDAPVVTAMHGCGKW